MRENYQGNVFSPMGCRSFLAPWKDENGDYKFEGRFNQGGKRVTKGDWPLVVIRVLIWYWRVWTPFFSSHRSWSITSRSTVSPSTLPAHS